MLDIRLQVLLTCFNRREVTLASLRALHISLLHAGVTPAAVLVDDGSTDGTGQAVREAFDWVQVVEHKGEPLFWCRGMHRALAEAARQGADCCLLLNDDTVLLPDAVARLLACERELHAAQRAPSVVVGSTRTAQGGALTYGGQRQGRWPRLTTFTRLQPAASPQRIDTFNGNIVLLPAGVVARVGNLDAAFEHAMGDTDYGLRARRAGVPVWLAPGFHGTCCHNPVAGTFNDRRLPLRQRWRAMLGRKGLPWRSWLHFTRRHAGLLWPLYFAWPYARVVVTGLWPSKGTR